MSEFDPSQAAEQPEIVWDERVRDHVRQGVPRSSIPALLVHDGMDEREANQIVDTRYDQIAAEVEAERVTPRDLLPIAAGALVAAIVGGIGWSLLANATDSEWGIAAWGIGLLVGVVVLNVARGKRGVQLQLIAVVAAFLGIAIGKYLSYVDAVKDGLTAEFGAEAADQFKTFSTQTVEFFIEDLDLIVSAYDLLWVGLAVVSAWRISQGTSRRFGRVDI